MITNTRDKILDFVRYHGHGRVEDFYRGFRISKVAIHKQVKRLIRDGLLVKIGKPPIVFYEMPKGVVRQENIEAKGLTAYEKQVIDANFLSITPDGVLLYGTQGFVYWIQVYGKNKSVKSVAQEYVRLVERQKEMFSEGGWLDATSKMTDTFKNSYVTKLFFGEVYSYKIFGRTKLAKLVMYAKQVGDRGLIHQVGEIVKPVVSRIIDKYLIEAVCFVPPTVPRPLQFMNELRSRLKLPLPEIRLLKVTPGDIPIPQKTLSSLEERIVNARDSIYLGKEHNFKYNKVLLIDDVVGSGSSFNEVAKKLHNGGIGKDKIIAFGLVGNIKGYEVIREI